MSNINPESNNNGKHDRYSSDEAAQADQRDQHSHSTDNAHDSQPESPGQLLDNVLYETLSATNSEQVVPLVTGFVEQNEGADITDLEVASRLIERVIDARMGSVELPEGISRWVAEQLLDDHDSRERLENLWNLALNQIA